MLYKFRITDYMITDLEEIIELLREHGHKTLERNQTFKVGHPAQEHEIVIETDIDPAEVTSELNRITENFVPPPKIEQIL